MKGSVSSRFVLGVFSSRSENTGRYVGFKEYREIGRKRAVKKCVCESGILV